MCVCIYLSLRWTHTWSVFWRTSTLCSLLQQSWKTSRKQRVRKKVFECWIWNCVRTQYVYIPENMRQICMSENTMGLVIKITSDQLNGSHKQWLGKVWWHTFYQNHSQQFNRAEPTLILLEIHSSKSIWSIMVYLIQLVCRWTSISIQVVNWSATSNLSAKFMKRKYLWPL